MDMKETRAKTKGMAKKAAKAVKGQTGIFSTLAEEHGKVSSLMNQLIEAEATERRRHFAEIRKELLAHAKAEEEQFYSALLRHTETRDEAQHAIEEHNQIERTLDDLSRRDATTEAWLEEFRTLRHRVEHHAKEEETELFPLADDALTKSEAKEMDRGFAKAKQRQMRAGAPAE